jgi:hypothetical protein
VAITELLGICEKHKSEILRINLGNGAILVTSLIYDFIYKPEEKLLAINWNRKFIPMISGQMPSGEFLTIDVRMDGVSSTHRYNLALLLQKNIWKLDKQGEFYLSEKLLRETLGLKDKYKEFNVLHTKIVKPTLGHLYDKLGLRLQSRIRGKDVKFWCGEEGS